MSFSSVVEHIILDIIGKEPPNGRTVVAIIIGINISIIIIIIIIMEHALLLRLMRSEQP